MPHFIVDLVWTRDGVGNFGADRVAISLPQAMDRNRHRAGTHPELEASLGILPGLRITLQELLEGIEDGAFASLLILLPEASQRLLKQG
jgi:hypothetical protein